KLPFLERPIPAMPVLRDGQVLPLDVLNTHTAWVKASKEIVGLMLMTMDPDIKKNLEHLGAYDVLKELKTFMGKTVTEFHAMLKLHEQTLSLKEAAPALHAIKAERIQKNQKKKSHKAAKGNQGKGKAKIGYAPVPTPSFAPKPKNPPTPKKDNPAKDAIYHQCGEGLKGSRKLKLGALSLYVGDGHRAAVEAIGEFHLCLPSGLVLILHNCHYAPSITRGIILRLYKDGFVNCFENDNSTSVSRNNLIYFNAILRDDIYEIDLSSSNTNDSFMYAVSNKRAKINLDTTLLWHCRLGHIRNKRIEKLQHDGLLDSTDIKSFEKYVSCMFGKMARKSYSHQMERAKDLLGLIHTDVSGPFKIMSRQRASYFALLLTTSVEVENQLRKTTKSLRSDLGGEYMSQEFLDHLKKHRIIAHRTPPYTPQHNSVSKRRNRTLLDMVCSMMSQTTLLKSFWDYALESAARILNMVPTKKVDKTPYKVWHGQVPKLSYLKVWGCEELVKRDTLTKPDKLEPRSIKSIFNSLIAQEASGGLKDLKLIPDEDTHPSLDTSLNHKDDDQEIDKPQSDINPIHRSTRTSRPTDRLCLYVDAEEHELGDLGEPANYKAALLDLESDKWLNAMNVEMQFMRDNEVWELVDLPPNGKTVGHKWIFKKKTDMDGAVHTYKARLVVKGFTQTPWIDYQETFSLVVDIRDIRILIAIAAFMTMRFSKWMSKLPSSMDISMKSAYIEKILKRYFKENSKRGTIPMQEKMKLSKTQGASTPAEIQSMQNIPYASANPGELHWTTVKNILKYLHNTIDMFLIYGGDTERELRVSCYTDAGYLTDADDLKS
nr:hypothetical protein [Tanacetum cinerariifolium]